MGSMCSLQYVPSVSSSVSCQVSTRLTTLGLHGFCTCSLDLPLPYSSSPRPHGLPSVPPDGIDEEEVIEIDFQGLNAEVMACSSELESLEMELRQQLLVNIGRILQDQPSMEALVDSVSESVRGGQGLPKPAQPHLPHPYLS